MKRRDVELVLFLAAATILSPGLQSMGVPWSIRLVIYFAPVGIILLYNWLTGRSMDTKAKAEQELVALIGSVETVNSLRTKYPALDLFFRNQDSEMITKIAINARDVGLLTVEQATALQGVADQWGQ